MDYCLVETYDALLHASHLVGMASDVIAVANGREEELRMTTFPALAEVLDGVEEEISMVAEQLSGWSSGLCRREQSIIRSYRRCDEDGRAAIDAYARGVAESPGKTVEVWQVSQPKR